MSVYVLILSKYILPFIILTYAISSLVCVMQNREKDRTPTYTVMLISASLMLLVSYLKIYYQTGDATYLFYYAFIQLGFFAFYVFFLIIYPRCCRLFLLNSCTLLTIGFLMLTRLNAQKAMRQFVIAILGFSLMMLMPHLVDSYTKLKGGELWYAIIGIAALGAVLVLGSLTNGSKISYSVFGISFQPSEFVKLLFIFYLASALQRKLTFVRFLIISAISAAYVLILTLSRDLGGALIYFIIYLFMILLATGKLILLPAGLVVLGAAGYEAYQLFPHIQVRVQAFLDPWSVIDGQGYQITQSLFAIGRGGLWGVGLFEGTASKIPYVEQDFMFAAIAEELGLIFALAMLLICVSTFLMALRVSLSLHDRFYRLSAFGFAVLYIFQVLLIVGGNVKFLLLTGVTLPLISYGGSSVISTLLMFGMLEGLYTIVGERGRNVDINETAIPHRIRGYYTGGLIHGVTAGIFTLLFVAMESYTWWYITEHAADLMNNSYNNSEQVLLTKNTRGLILARDGEILAENDEETEERIYPYGNLFAHIVGYTDYGYTGIESLANYYLLHSGISLSEQIENAKADKKNPGDHVTTTLDVDLQTAARKAIGAYYGAVIATDVKTGEVLAMVSTPDYDPNELTSVLIKAAEDETSSVLVNRAINGLYPPGSTFKIITAMEYLMEHDHDVSDFKFNCSGSVTIEGIRIRCYHGVKHGTVDFEKAFAKSCNSAFATIASSLDWDQFDALTQQLMFGQTLPFELTTSVSSMVQSENSDLEAKLQAGIGQGSTLMTPFHLNLITCAIANGGVLQYPYVLKSVETVDGQTTQAFTSPGSATLMDETIAETLTEMMTQVVEQGTATKLSGLAYTVAGKTGSAEYNSEGESHAWFTGFAPADDPQIAVTVILEGAGSGGDDAAPVARRVFDAYFE